MPENEFHLMKEAADMSDLVSSASDSTSILIDSVFEYIVNIKKINYNEVYPDYDFNTILPELNIGEDGYPMYNEYEILYGFDFYPENSSDLSTEELINYILESNKDFNLLHISEVCSTLKISGSYNEEEINEIFNFEKLFEIGDLHSGKTTNPVNNEIPTEEELDATDDDFFSTLDFKTKNASVIFELNG